MRVLLTGAGGILGHALRAELPRAGIALTAFTHAQLDITDEARTRQVITQHAPDVVINCAAFTQVDDAETREADAAAINTHAAGSLARLCGERGIRIVYPSTDYVFAGDRRAAYAPADVPRPLNAYGRTKLGGEVGTRAVRDHLIIRTSWLFGGGGPNFVRTMTGRLQSGGPLRVVDDQTARPTYARDLAQAITRLLQADVAPGTYHVANSGRASWFEFAQEIALLAGRPGAVTPCTTAEFPRPAPRPPWSVLDTTATDKLIGELRDWRAALADALEHGDY